jgi:hypothetical protein
MNRTFFDGSGIYSSPGSAKPRLSAQDAYRMSGADRSKPLGPVVKATLAYQTGLPNWATRGHRLVWIFGADSVAIYASEGPPFCGAVNVIVDATTGQELSETDGPRF